MWPVPPRGSDEVIIINQLSKSYYDSKNNEIKIFQGLNTTINRGEKIAIVGVNGAGKITLLKCLAKVHEPTSGMVTHGPSIKFGYFGQYSYEMDEKQLNMTLEEFMQYSLPQLTDGHIRNILAAFLFKGDDIQQKLRHLSGGERARIILSILFSQHNNLLILDEPTNHLDLRSREILLDALQKYEGTVLFVTHDRHFLLTLAQKVLEVSKQSIQIYPGNYQYYLSTKSQ